MLLLGITIFAGASVFAALAPTGDLLIASRVLQGVGGAMVLPTTLSLINATFRGKERALAFAVWGSTIGGMVAVGPLLGGWLTTYFSWRWAFGINIPLGLIVFIGVLLTVQESKASGLVQKIDVLSAVLSVVMSATLVFGLIEGRTYGWWNVEKVFAVGDWSWPFEVSPIPFAFAVSLVSGALFVIWGRRRMRLGQSTLLPFDLFRVPSFRNGNIAALIVSLGEFGIVLSLPLWLQNVVGYDALQTGFVLLALAIGSFVASGFAGAFGNKIAAVMVVRIGIASEIVGVAGLGWVISSSSTWVNVVPWLFVYGFGVGLATAQLTGVVLKDVPVAQSGQGSGAQSTSRQFGSALGIAILGTVLFTSTAAGLDARLNDQGVPEAERTKVVEQVVDSAGSAIIGLNANPQTAKLGEAASEAFTQGVRFSAFTAAGFLCVGLAATLSLGGGASVAGKRAKRSEPSV
jgi:EmrB/QacA subfamily drug resistance transporter